MKMVLIAEDNDRIRETIAGYLRDAGYTPLLASTGLDALKLARELRPEVILLDGLLPQLHGFELARLVRSIDPDYQPAMVLVSGVYTTNSFRRDARLRYGIAAFVSKPFTRDQLLASIEEACRERDAA